MEPVSLPRSKIGASERGPFSAYCAADIKVAGHRRSAGKHSLTAALLPGQD
jgi:hypothetical protein